MSTSTADILDAIVLKQCLFTVEPSIDTAAPIFSIKFLML